MTSASSGGDPLAQRIVDREPGGQPLSVAQPSAGQLVFHLRAHRSRVIRAGQRRGDEAGILLVQAETRRPGRR